MDTEHQTSPCNAGEVAVDESSCMSCGVGYYADQAIQQCIICPLDTFSLGLVDECLPCEHGLGTLEMGSTAETDCQGDFYSLIGLDLDGIVIEILFSEYLYNTTL